MILKRQEASLARRTWVRMGGFGLTLNPQEQHYTPHDKKNTTKDHTKNHPPHLTTIEGARRRCVPPPTTPTLWSRRQPWPLYDIGITNIVWCMAYTREVGGGGRILPNSRAVVLHQGGQCRRARGMKAWLNRAQQPRSERISCKGQGGSELRLAVPVASTEGISEIWVREPFPRWGVLRCRVKVRFTYGWEFTRSSSETPLWSNSGFDGHSRDGLTRVK